MSVLLEERRGPVAVLTLNRPEVLNALNSELMEELSQTLDRIDQDPVVRVVVLTGNERAFAAGADIQELYHNTPVTMLQSKQINRWESIRKFSKPLIAAVRGWALGGGMELVMACDMVICGDDAHFGQPEIKIGVMPGAGGTQRLTKTIGKVRAMEMVLTGRTIDADEAFRMGLVNRVVPTEQVVDHAVSLAETIAGMPPVAVRLAKESVLTALDTPLEVGLTHERRLFSLLFGTEDQKEGMQAFLEKRKPEFKGR
ncbi:Enoyl-CoA hydratase/isomerase [Sulfobacillus acidophilus TPY]|uniref:short-chain-enoyl-CoA hydratase n=1 Tax=Sulfobacillus acidophilus (strain ATCC 700253 / DSM 10332 / NAL) TaxID=679936 RepID=G8TZT3_SULAD|nr:Enoyl-CoA hydratase/isomerase [Sulfobacillus acidophilus TPY]AEW06413.1 short chain enoyl-CoA hydratase [Sulfobacillus acidophilus DSM 10332]